MPIGCSSFGTTSSWARVRSGLISVNTRPNSLSNGASGNGCMLLCLHGRRSHERFRGVGPFVHDVPPTDTVSSAQKRYELGSETFEIAAGELDGDGYDRTGAVAAGHPGSEADPDSS